MSTSTASANWVATGQVTEKVSGQTKEPSHNHAKNVHNTVQHKILLLMCHYSRADESSQMFEDVMFYKRVAINFEIGNCEELSQILINHSCMNASTHNQHNLNIPCYNSYFQVSSSPLEDQICTLVVIMRTSFEAIQILECFSESKTKILAC